MSPPEVFKYNSLISIPLFSIIALLLIKTTSGFSFSASTISRSVFHIKGRFKRIIFRLNFIFKALLDLGFYWYLIDHFKIPGYSSFGFYFLFSIIFFALLGYFIEGKHSVVHHVLIYGLGVFWLISQALLAQLTKDGSFILFTGISTVIGTILAFGSLFAKKTNVFIQLICISIFYLWLTIFVFYYL